MIKLLASVLLLVVVSTSNAWSRADAVGHLRLKDRLDRPNDGYCLDILGVGRTLRVDVPIFAHNCKARLTPDSTVRLQSDGRIAFPAVGLCVTAFGVNGRALPGSPIILRPCGERAAFFEAAPLQAFALQQSGRVVLDGTNLCLAVGVESAATYSVQDRWRALSVQDCKLVPGKYSIWELNTGPFPER